MRTFIAVTVLAALTACATIYPATTPQPAMGPRTLDTTIAVGTPEDRRFLAQQVQRCYLRQMGLLQSDADERARILHEHNVIMGAFGLATALVTVLAVTHPGTLIGPAGLGIVLGGTALLGAAARGMLPSVPPSAASIREHTWFNVVTQVEDWETAARDLAGAQHDAAASQGASPQSIDPLVTAWRHADNALRSSLATCLP